MSDCNLPIVAVTSGRPLLSKSNAIYGGSEVLHFFGKPQRTHYHSSMKDKCRGKIEDTQSCDGGVKEEMLDLVPMKTYHILVVLG